MINKNISVFNSKIRSSAAPINCAYLNEHLSQSNSSKAFVSTKSAIQGAIWQSKARNDRPDSYSRHKLFRPHGGPGAPSNSTDGREVKTRERRPFRDNQYRDAPISIPYTTSASEFLYGTNPVAAALKAGRRKLYKLYTTSDIDTTIRRVARQRNVPTVTVESGDSRMLDKMSDGRPHNGFVLEASPLPKLPVKGLVTPRSKSEFRVVLENQSAEEVAVNGTNPIIEYRSSFSRYPFILCLDGILDPGNLGAILRSAFFLGVDAVAITDNCTAPLSPVALKAAAGAAEALPILTIRRNAKFLASSKAAGWEVIAADVPSIQNEVQNYQQAPVITVTNLGCPLREKARILVIGSEEKGLFRDVRRMADSFVIIEGQRQGEGGVESLNVSVAAALLCEAFLRKPQGDVIF